MIYRKDLPKSFKVKMPEIYQIEVSSLCNYNCIMCPRIMGYKRKDETPFISIDLVKKLIDEDSFSGSYFVELHMTGEPLLHPELGKIVGLIKSTGVKVGLSTNGSLIHEKLSDLEDLDYMTVSVDSLSNYSLIRRNGKIDRLIENIKLLRNIKASVDLQVIELEGWEKEFEAVKEMFPYFYVRSINDCALTILFEVDQLPVSNEMCLNPWMSVSIHSNGNVVPCCFSFWDDIIYGNIKDSTLKEIWEGDAVRKLREQHQNRNYSTICERCYMRSPVLLHWEIYLKSIKEKL